MPNQFARMPVGLLSAKNPAERFRAAAKVVDRMAKISAGLLMYRRRGGELQLFLVHLGGPFFAKKDFGAWSIPKGECEPGEDLLLAARREFEEETGLEALGNFVPLTPIRQPSGKVIHAWAFEGDCDPATIKSNTFSMEWPPRSGKKQEFPEVDRGGWFDLDDAKKKVFPGQVGFLEEAHQVLSRNTAKN
jgi:predicted NUDIX family NTP pyrophosphohydrolase